MNLRRTAVATFGAALLSVPTANAVAAVRNVAIVETVPTKKKITVVTKTINGPAVQAHEWGNIQVTIVVKKTTTTVGTKSTVTRKITSVTVPQYPNHTNRSVYINQQALPYLIQETLQAQSANIQMVSGASDTSDAFIQSLQGALLLGSKV
jgi:uncharacterized protein with FMN-binding domain